MIEIIGWHQKCVQNALLKHFSPRFNKFRIGIGRFNASHNAVTVKRDPTVDRDPQKSGVSGSQMGNGFPNAIALGGNL